MGVDATGEMVAYFALFFFVSVDCLCFTARRCVYKFMIPFIYKFIAVSVGFLLGCDHIINSEL